MYRVFRLSRTPPREYDPPVVSKIDTNITYFAFFSVNCMVLGVQGEGKRRGREGEERRRGGGGERGSRVLDILDGHWASIRRTGSEVNLEGNLCSSWSNFVDHFASKRYVFQLKQHCSPN